MLVLHFHAHCATRAEKKFTLFVIYSKMCEQVYVDSVNKKNYTIALRSFSKLQGSFVNNADDLTAVVFVSSVKTVVFSSVAALRQFNTLPVATSPLWSTATRWWRFGRRRYRNRNKVLVMHRKLRSGSMYAVSYCISIRYEQRAFVRFELLLNGCARFTWVAY